jgi:hypothetical protein
VRNILSALQPRKVVIVNGTPAATDRLRRFCVESIDTVSKAFAPTQGQTMDMESDTVLW